MSNHIWKANRFCKSFILVNWVLIATGIGILLEECAIDMENLPCAWTGREIEAEHPGLGRAYPAAAKGRRGLTAWVEREGALHLNDALTLFIPAQRKWRG